MDRLRVALGLYTVCEEMKADLAGTLRQVAGMGYEGVEFYGEPEYEVRQVRAALEGAGLELCGWHIEWRHLQPERLEQTMRYLEAVGNREVIVPCLGGRWQVGHTLAEESRARWEAYVARLNQLSDRLAGAGLRLGYHTPDHEFRLCYEGEPVFALLFDHLAPRILMELDTGNALEGGADPVAWLERYPHRPLAIHCKPYSASAGFDVALGAPGDLNDWAAILVACRPRQPWLVVESESRAGTGLENARAGIEGLRRFC
ncbi:MAG: sugar phosphate isomerase/epimerase [Candidatus Latescibacteria bacterium]|nr:sugar phosphate isomerase/epimerase [Candidatus Latescibacterota bacterium]